MKKEKEEKVNTYLRAYFIFERNFILVKSFWLHKLHKYQILWQLNFLDAGMGRILHNFPQAQVEF